MHEFRLMSAARPFSRGSPCGPNSKDRNRRIQGTLRLDLCVLCTLCVLPYSIVSAQQQPKTHRLEATPATVAYGYYWSEARPVLRIESRDIIDVDTLLTNTPRGLERAGVKPDDVQGSLRNVVDTVTDKGPGGHILTGPVYVEGAEP